MQKSEATEIAGRYSIPLNVDFHSLPSSTVERVVNAADERKYRAPRNANGSRARYFFYMLARASRQKVPEYVVQGCYDGKWEDVTANPTRKDTIANLREYRANDPQNAYRMIVRRVPA